MQDNRSRCRYRNRNRRNAKRDMDARSWMRIARHDGKRSRYRFRPRHRWKQRRSRTPANRVQAIRKARARPSTLEDRSSWRPADRGGLVKETIPGTSNEQRGAPSRHRTLDGASHMRRSGVPSLLCAARPGGTRFVASVHDGGHEGPWPSRWGPLIRLLEARSSRRPVDPGRRRSA